MLKNKKLALLLIVMLVASFSMMGCGNDQQGEAPAEPKGTVEILYVEWACATATSNVIAQVLEEKMGYEVNLTPVGAAVMYQGIATGDGDAMFCAWLPVTHASYMEEVGDQVEQLAVNMRGARIGLVVPEYVDINSIEEMNEVRDQFNGEIIGIDPGAGIMSTTETAMEEYGLDAMELMVGSGATMTAALADAIRHEQWLVITGWSPHWKFARWDLKYLEDPKNIYGGAEAIHTIVRQGLKEDMPEVYHLLDNFHWSLEDMQQVMVWNSEEGASPYENAKRWVEENDDKVQAWLR